MDDAQGRDDAPDGTSVARPRRRGAKTLPTSPSVAHRDSTDTGAEVAGNPVRGTSELAASGHERSTEVSSDVTTAGKASKLVVAISGGTGVGYVSGTTEGGNKVQTCCLGVSLIVIKQELDYPVSAELSIGVAVRLGLPLDANIAGHSTLAPAVFSRMQRAFSDSGDGIRVMGEVGVGVLRNTIKIDVSATDMPGMDTDIVAQGPLLLGAGIGYSWQPGGRVALLAELDAIAGIAVVRTFGGARNLNSGVSADVSVGLAVGF